MGCYRFVDKELEKLFDSSMHHQENKLTIQAAAESTWTRDENKLFEKALVNVLEDIVECWQKMADAVPGKTAEQVRAHYEVLVHDIDEIESGRVELPSYADDDDDDGKESFLNWDSEMRSQISFETGKGSKHGEGERKKGTPWTEDEHRKFLEGLTKYGKGDWRSISRNSVISRTPTQVASHAQKYFLRQTSMKKERKRSSIHDITTTNITMVVKPQPLPSPSTNFSGGQGGAPPQLGYEYQHNFRYPF